MLCAAAGAMAQSNRTRVKLLMPLVFDKQKVVNDTLKSPSIQPEKKSAPDLDYDRFWLDDVLSDRERVDHERYRTILKSPEVVPYNSQNMREAPKEYVVKANPSKNYLEIETPKVEEETMEMPTFIDRRPEKRHNWLHTFGTSTHFTQAFYQRQLVSRR
ncbi:MAG: hypothetical protein L6U16_12870 [Porphyromonadaceae bacterium]|nr:MAG: hypothetical protein L6U16_12870 [Porphyromonadaceae bacterium]